MIHLSENYCIDLTANSKFKTCGSQKLLRLNNYPTMSIPGQQICSDSECPLAERFSNSILQQSSCPAKEKLKNALSATFKFDSFRPGQLQALLPLVHGKDVFVNIPTGGGKSMCMFLFPLPLNDTAMGLIISPLVGLLDQQVSLVNV